MARNTKKDKAKLIELLQANPFVGSACKKVGISRATYYRWLQDDVFFKKATNDALDVSSSSINDLAESKLVQNIENNNLSSIIFWLKHNSAIYKDPPRLKFDIQNPSEREMTDLIIKYFNYKNGVDGINQNRG